MCELTQAVSSFIKIKLQFAVKRVGDKQMLLMKLQHCVSDRQRSESVLQLEMQPEVILGFPLFPQELTIIREIFAENKLINNHFTHYTPGLCARLTHKMLLRFAGKQG